MVTEAFPDPALEPVADHGAARNAARNGEPESGMVRAVGTHDDRDDLGVQPDTAGKDLCEIVPPPQPVLRPEPPIGGMTLRRRVFFVPSHAVR